MPNQRFTLSESFCGAKERKDVYVDPCIVKLRVLIFLLHAHLVLAGLGSLMELIKYAEESADVKIKVDMYGGGPDQDAAKAKAESLELDMPFHGPVDHAELASTHKIFVNPSTSEVLCTTSAEALAMVRDNSCRSRGEHLQWT